ncbi:GNAT family N-acetyltransferase [Mucilaginibacter agri]|uniref:GNAT family N-acetyltransferase n=1 Tax=Mucilaginibacter agri TaxID=2695265 RepID=A0A965ZH71_9SPHI|nr:GNAT family N-acetyltransferase [Mucilaginibacter agri]NCD70017.1 GNAT family N-acetyltransferase [Mucilaginibacter agri]
MDITYKTDVKPTTQQIIDLYNSAGLKRPTEDADRIGKIYENSNLVITAWDGDLLVGVSRTITDFYYTAYLADLAIKLEYQKEGIGKKLVALTKETLGDQCMMLLLSAPTAMEYYPKIGMDTVNNGFIIQRKK